VIDPAMHELALEVRAMEAFFFDWRSWVGTAIIYFVFLFLIMLFFKGCSIREAEEAIQKNEGRKKHDSRRKNSKAI
jgi:hypothetical protein